MRATSATGRWSVAAPVWALLVTACGESNGPVSSLEITVSTTGRDLDNGYSLTVDGGALTPLPANGTVTLETLVPGDHALTIGDVAGNCTLEGPVERTVTLTAGTPALLSLNVICAFANALAYAQGDTTSAVYVTGIEPGAGSRRIADNFSSPTWAPDGGSLALVSTVLPYAIFVADADGGNQRQVTPNTAQTERFYALAWSPDGRTLLYNYRNRLSPNSSLYVIIQRINIDGTGRTSFIPGSFIGGPLITENPAWSPDGSRVAYEGNGSVCVATADGTLERCLARGGFPQWSPDGTRIAFTAEDGIHTIAPDGSGEQMLTP